MTASAARLGERLVAAGIATPEQVQRALTAQRTQRGRLGYHLVRAAGVPAPALSAFLQEEMGGPDAELTRSPDAILAAVPARLAHLFNAYPLEVLGDRLELAVPPVSGAETLEAIGRAAGLHPEPRVVPAEVLRRAVERDYLGAAAPTVHEPASGLPTLVIDAPELGVRPVAADLRTPDLSPEAWLRSVVAEAVSRACRTVLLVPGPAEARLTLTDGADPAESRHAADRQQAVARFATRLARCDPPGRSAASAGRFLVEIRGRRTVVGLVQEATPHGPRIRIALADQRPEPDDLDAACAPREGVVEGIEAAVDQGRGLVLTCGPAGGGVRWLGKRLAARLAETVPGSAHVGTAASGPFEAQLTARGDAQVAAALHRALEGSAGLVFVEELPGPRSVERALLAAARRLVVGHLPSADGVGALAWLTRHGFGGAVKNGLLRATLSVLGQDAVCSCAEERPPAVGLAARWALGDDLPTILANRGCERCHGGPVHAPRVLVAWRDVASSSAPDGTVDDPVAVRARDRELGVPPTTVDLAVAGARPGAGGELGAVERLLDWPGPA